MRLKFSTTVSQSYKAVFAGFDVQLFKALKPPLMPLKVLRFDGCRKGDEVHLQLGPSWASQSWISDIVNSGQTNDLIFFEDVGRVTPFPIRFWHHKHIIERKAENQATIIDDIEYRTGWKLIDYLMYPVLYFQFAGRDRVYKQYFKSKNEKSSWRSTS